MSEHHTNHFIIEKDERLLLPQFILINNARKRINRVLPGLLKKRKKKVEVETSALMHGNIDEVINSNKEVMRTEKRIIHNIEIIMVDVTILMERKMKELQRTYNIVKKDQPKYANELMGMIKDMENLFKSWFERILAYEEGSRTYISANADVLFHEAGHILWAMRYIDNRGEQRAYKKVISFAKKGIRKIFSSTNIKEQQKHDNKFFSAAKILRKKLKKIITEADVWDKDMLQASLEKTQEFDAEDNKIISKLESSGFPLDDLNKLKEELKNRKKHFQDFLKHHRDNLNTVIKFNVGVSKETKEMKQAA